MGWVTFGDVDFMSKSLLLGNKIPFCEKEIIAPFTGVYLFIPDTYSSKIVSPGVQYRLVETNIPGFKAMIKEEENEFTKTMVVSSVVRENATAKYEVAFYDSISKTNISDALKLEFKKVIEKFTVLIDKNIKLGIPHNKLKDAPEADLKYFYVYLWSQCTANNLERVGTPATMWGIPVSCADNSFQPSGRGTAIITDEGHCVAELLENTLYIHHDICHKNTQDEIILFERILHESFLLYKVPEDKKEEYKKREIEASNKRSKAAFNLFFSQQIKNKLNNTHAQIKDNEYRIDQAQADITKLLALNKEHSNFICFAEEKIKNLDKITADEYEKLLKIEKVVGVVVTNNVLTIKTKPIYINGKDLNGNKAIYFIGEFTVSIHPNGKIVFYNLSNKGEGPGLTQPNEFNANFDYNRHHPHINVDGRACLGNLSSVIGKYLADCNLSVLITLLIKFLETADTNDHAGRGLYWWPIVPESKE